MKRALSILTLTLSAAAALLLTACGEKPQINAQGVRSDAAPWSGPGTAFTAPGWTPGDQGSWESHLKARMQSGQNEYTRIN